ncbi:hypothetical protein [Thermoflavifilum thermophilum]|nr:hypothetical protein [Thermoflavifilum thermophilum]
MMRRSYLCLFFLVLAATQVNFTRLKAQNNARALQRIEALKIAYISQRLNLTPEEAEKFWPIYNQYEQEMNAARQQHRQQQLNAQHLASATDAQVNEALNDELAYEQQLVDIRKKYRQQFERVLPPRKVALLFVAEREFTNQLINQLKERQQRRRLQQKP